ncbi:hypothetical protein [Pedobacter xixiisoli]|uniref:N-formylglutamate amidohydrolase n=1 Tax=Pedobacter xixiisoli TaxID=1476464 RepID=A0A286A961_9SPHI|nr:hypothetical protein [Pedobacter xixiisoli]SOD18411.1 hypothetical protein SAMN06297358_2990 [Pedobacter xixiisoli]
MKRINLWILASLLLTATACKKSNSGTDEGKKEEPQPVVEYKPNTTYYGKGNLVKLVTGDLNSPIILASPHDGTEKPEDMPVRTHTDAVVVRDLYLTDVTEKVAAALYAKTGLRPHIVINYVERARMEPNRALAETYHKSEAANALWREYHEFLKGAKEMVEKNVGKGLFLDMHGHGHDKDRIEVGYLTAISDLNGTDDLLNNKATASSIYNISTTSPYSFSQLIRGDYAFGTLLANEGVKAVPSKQDPKPNSDPYFNGGYCTLTYGSKVSGKVSAIQLETPGPGFRDNAALRTASAPKVADAIIKYMQTHYGLFIGK